MVTATVGDFNVTSNSGSTQAQLERDLKPKADDVASKAGSELGKRGGKAAAEKRAAEKSDLKAEQSEPDEKPEPVEAKAEPEAKEDKAEEHEKAEEKPEKKGDPRHDPKARMLEATRKEAEAKRALAAEREARTALEARLEALERTGKPAPAEQPKRDPDAKPTPDGFESYEEYLDARDAYNRKTWETESSRRSQAEATQRAVDEQKRKFSEVTVPNLEKYSEEVLSLQTEFQIPEGAKPSGANWVANELFFSPESAPTLMLHLTEHPEELQRLAALTSPRAVSREMAKMEARLEAATTATSPEREVVSRAAPPVRPVTGKPYVSESDEYRPGMNLDEYARIWNKQKRIR